MGLSKTVLARVIGAIGRELPWRAISSGVLFPRENFTQAGLSDVTQMMSYSAVPIKRAAQKWRLVIPHVSWNSSLHVERIPAGVTTCRVSVEFPIGTITQVTKDGADTFVLPNGYCLETDDINIPVAPGHVPLVRIYRSCDTPGELPCSISLTTGDAGSYGTSVTDKTGTPNSVGNSGSLRFHPVAVIAQGDFVAPLLIGDSRVMGTGDQPDATGSLGELARGFGIDAGYVNVGTGSDRSDWFVSSCAVRSSLAKYCSHVVSELGINDFGASRLAASVVNSQKQIRAIFPSHPFYLTTVTVAQTTASTRPSYNTRRVEYNDLVRAGIDTVDGYFETADPVESDVYDSGISVRNGGWFKVATYSTDFLHMRQAGYIALRDSGAVRASMLT